MYCLVEIFCSGFVAFAVENKDWVWMPKVFEEILLIYNTTSDKDCPDQTVKQQSCIIREINGAI